MSRKKYLYVKLALLVLLLLVVLGLAFKSFTGFGFFSFSFGNNFNGDEIKTEETYIFDGIDSIQIDGISLDIRLEKGTDDSVTMTDNTATNEEYTKNRYLVRGDELIFWEYRDFFGNSSNHGEIVITLPPDIYYAIEINTVDGGIQIPDIKAENISINAVDSNIDILATGDSLDINTVDSKIYSHNSFTYVDINLVDGDIYLTADENSQNIDVNGVACNLNVKLVDIAEISVDLTSISGGINNEYDNVSLTTESPVKITFDGVDGNVNLLDWE